MLLVRLAGRMRGQSAVFALLSGERMAAPLDLVASEANAGPVRGYPGAARVTLSGQISLTSPHRRIKQK